MFNLVLFGAPGSGKGVQSAKLTTKYALEHIAPGNIFRKEIAAGTSLGRTLQHYMDQGNLVPEKIVIDSVQMQLETLQPKASGFIFDGYPRSLQQAQALDAQLKLLGAKLDLVLLLKVDEETIVQRLALRNAIEGRSDDAKEKVRHRLALYRQYSKPIISYYRARNQLVEINGIGTEAIVTSRLMKVIEAQVPTK